MFKNVDQIILTYIKHIIDSKLFVILDNHLINLIQKENNSISFLIDTIYNQSNDNIINIRHFILYFTILSDLLTYVKLYINSNSNNLTKIKDINEFDKINYVINSYNSMITNIIRKYDNNPIWFTIRFKINQWYNSFSSYICSRLICICCCMCDEHESTNTKIYIQPIN